MLATTTAVSDLLHRPKTRQRSDHDQDSRAVAANLSSEDRKIRSHRHTRATTLSRKRGQTTTIEPADWGIVITGARTFLHVGCYAMTLAVAIPQWMKDEEAEQGG